MFKSLILIVILLHFSVKTMDWCPLITTNGKYNGLGIYHRRVGLKSEHKYVMFNKLGHEWDFKISTQFSIELFNDSVKTYNSTNVVNRFSTYTPLNLESNLWFDCDLISKPVIIDKFLK